MVRLAVDSLQWRAEGVVVNLVLTNVSEKISSGGLRIVDFSIATSKHPGEWRVRAHYTGEPSLLVVTFRVRGADDQKPAYMMGEAMVPHKWLPARSGRIFCRDLGWQEHRLPDWTSYCFVASLQLLDNIGFIEKDTLHVQVCLGLPSVHGKTEGVAVHQFGRRFEPEELSDMTFIAKGKEFQVHRCILAAHSPVLKSLICAGMSESARRLMEVEDMEATTAAAFLQFLYHGSCSDPSRNDLGTSSIASKWYSWFSIGRKSGPDNSFDLTAPLRAIHAMAWLDLRHQGEDIDVVGSILSTFGGDERFTTGDDVFKQIAPDSWMCDEPNKNEKYVMSWKDCFLVLRCDPRDSGSKSYWNYLFCKDGEVEFAHFWGRLLCAADKYCVEKLAAMCEERMAARLSVWSAVPMLQYACRTSRQSLKRDIIGFITLNDDFLQSVKDMPEYDTLDQDLREEIADAFLAGVRRSRKRPGHAGLEFADGQDWGRLSCTQLRRACAERGLDTGGNQAALAALLRAQGSDDA